jgi:hypothetical protein
MAPMRALLGGLVVVLAAACEARAPAITAEPTAAASGAPRAATDPLGPAPPLSASASSSAALPDCPGGGCNPGGVVAEMSTGFRRCYREGLAQDPKMQGKVEVHATIGPNGDVVSVTPKATGLSPEVVRCVADRVRKGKFTPPAQGTDSVVIPVTFVPD